MQKDKRPRCSSSHRRNLRRCRHMGRSTPLLRLPAAQELGDWSIADWQLSGEGYATRQQRLLLEGRESHWQATRPQLSRGRGTGHRAHDILIGESTDRPPASRPSGERGGEVRPVVYELEDPMNVG